VPSLRRPLLPVASRFLLLSVSRLALAHCCRLRNTLWYGVVVCTVVAMVGSVIAFRSHRHLVWLLLSVGSGLLVITALRLLWPPSVAYAGLLGLAGAAVANHVLVRRALCTVMPRSTAQRPSEKVCSS
jgi:CBS-domain-containing membrane protein